MQNALRLALSIATIFTFTLFYGCRTVDSDSSSLTAVGDNFQFDWGESAQILFELEQRLTDATGCKRTYLTVALWETDEMLPANSVIYHQERLNKIRDAYRDVPQTKWYLYRQYLLNIRTNIENLSNQIATGDRQVLASIKRRYASKSSAMRCAIDLYRNATDYYFWKTSGKQLQTDSEGKRVFVFFGGISEFDNDAVVRNLRANRISQIEAPWSDKNSLQDLLQRQLRFFSVTPVELQSMANKTKVRFYLATRSTFIPSKAFNLLLKALPKLIRQSGTIAKHYFTYKIDHRDTHTDRSGVKVLFAGDEQLSWYYAGDSVDRLKDEGGPVTLIRYIKLDLVTQSVDQALNRLTSGDLR